ncbi:hypothetical protein Tco_0151786 [Tanacetum coccineum]
MSQARLQRLGEQLGLDARAAAIEDDIGIDMLSYEENLGNLLVSHQNDKASPMKDQYKSYPSKKMMRAKMVEADEKSKLEEWRSTGNIRPERHSRGNLCIAQTQNNDKVISNTSHLANVDMVEDDDKSKPGIFYIALWGHTFLKSSCCINDCENSDVAFHVNKMAIFFSARILRGLRIAARLGLSFSKDIEAVIHRQAPSLLNLATDNDGGRLYDVMWCCGIFNPSTPKISHSRDFATDSDKADIVDRFSSKRFKISSTFLKKREHLDVLQKRQMLVVHIEHGETTGRGKSKTPGLSHLRLEAIDKCSINFFGDGLNNDLSGGELPSAFSIKNA